MTKVLSLDISTKTGWALFDEDTKQLLDKGLVKLDKTVKEYVELFGYPKGFFYAAQQVAVDIFNLIEKHDPVKIIIEETNPSGRAGRYSQKILEYIHCQLLDLIFSRLELENVYYINSSEWRKKLKISLTNEDKKNNKLAKTKESKKKFKIKGKITKKHLAVRYVNEKYNLSLLVQDNDIADAICLGDAYLNGAKLCDGQ